MLRGELIGSLLVVGAFLLILSMLSATQGLLTGAIIEIMHTLFGAGAWLAPVLIGVLGAWLALRQVTDQRVLTPQRLAGIIALFVVLEAFVHLFTGDNDPWAGQGGGALGYAVGQTLVVVLGEVGTIALLALGVIMCGVTLTGISWTRLGTMLRAGWRQLHGTTPGPEGVHVNTPLPLGAGRSFWGRLWHDIEERFLPRPAPSLSKAPPPPPRWMSASRSG